MIRRVLMISLLVISSYVSFAQTSNENSNSGPQQDSLSWRFDSSRDPGKDLNEAIITATQTHKRILLDVGGEWCIWCRRLDTLFATHSDLSSFLNGHFVVVKVNYSKENKNEKFLSRFPKIPGYSHYFVLEHDGALLKSQDTGELEEGKGHSPSKVMTFLKTWAQ